MVGQFVHLVVGEGEVGGSVEEEEVVEVGGSVEEAEVEGEDSLLGVCQLFAQREGTPHVVVDLVVDLRAHLLQQVGII